MRTEDIVRRDGTLYARVDYTEWLVLQLRIIRGLIKEPLYFKNKWGGIDEIDEFGTSHYKYFNIHHQLLKQSIREQMRLRIEREKTNNDE